MKNNIQYLLLTAALASGALAPVYPEDAEREERTPVFGCRAVGDWASAPDQLNSDSRSSGRFVENVNNTCTITSEVNLKIHLGVIDGNGDKEGNGTGEEIKAEATRLRNCIAHKMRRTPPPPNSCLDDSKGMQNTDACVKIMLDTEVACGGPALDEVKRARYRQLVDTDPGPATAPVSSTAAAPAGLLGLIGADPTPDNGADNAPRHTVTAETAPDGGKEGSWVIRDSISGCEEYRLKITLARDAATGNICISDCSPDPDDAAGAYCCKGLLPPTTETRAWSQGPWCWGYFRPLTARTTTTTLPPTSGTTDRVADPTPRIESGGESSLTDENKDEECGELADPGKVSLSLGAVRRCCARALDVTICHDLDSLVSDCTTGEDKDTITVAQATTCCEKHNLVDACNKAQVSDKAQASEYDVAVANKITSAVVLFMITIIGIK